MSFFSSICDAIFGTQPRPEPKVEPPSAALTPLSCLVLGIIESLKKEPEAWKSREYGMLGWEYYDHKNGALITVNTGYKDGKCFLCELSFRAVWSSDKSLLPPSDQQAIYDAIRTYLIEPAQARLDQSLREMRNAANEQGKIIRSYFETLGCPSSS